ncbi:MAG: hypothetical protein PHD76_00110 [Methylacidiphilales bacterium]|nr:hypothetical protein [Candidatus Methylacidiphilales bacterium]
MKQYASRFRQWMRGPDLFLLRSALCILMAACLLALAGWGACLGYWQAKRIVFLDRAQKELEKGDYGQAFFHLQITLARFPGDIRASEMLVKLGDATRAPWTLEWKSRLHAIAPENDGYTLALAEEALRSGRPAMARNVAGTLLNRPDKTAAAENILAAVCVSEGKIAEAGQHFAKARQLKPSSEAILKNYLAFQISNNPKAQSALIESLFNELDSFPGGKASERRLRILWLLQLKRWQEALAISQQLIKETASPDFFDQLQHLSLVAAFDPAGLESYLQQMEKSCSKDPLRALPLINWMTRNRLNERALRFISSLPQQLRGLGSVQEYRAACEQALGQTRYTVERLEHEKWSQAEEYLRWVILARAYDALGDHSSALNAQGQAVNAAKFSALTTMRLLVEAERWSGWSAQLEPLLLNLGGSPALQESAFFSVYDYYRKIGDARGMGIIAQRLLTFHPADPALNNNAVYLALLNGSSYPWIYRKAKQLADDYPKNPQIRSTYAFSLLLQKKGAEALAVMDKIPDSFRERSGIALYYGLALRANGREAEAARVLKKIDPATLLDAERKLLGGGANTE